MFPQGLIDQWLSKPREGRRSVQEDPKATPAILRNIHDLEVHCQEHPYEVFCASSLRSPPFALYALENEEDEKARLARPPAMFAAVPPLAPADVYAATHANSDSVSSGGLGGRYRDKAEIHSTTMAAASHLQDVTSRLTTYLQSSGMFKPETPPNQGSSTPNPSEKAAGVAQLVVRVITEAAVAAAVRQGVAARVEAAEHAAYQRQQSSRRLQLRVGSKDDAPATKQHSVTASRGEIDSHDTEEKEEDDYYVAARAIADYRRDCQGLLSMAGLLRKLGAGIDVDRDDDESSPAPALRKRGRSDTARAEGRSIVVAAERDGRINYWARLRADGLRRFFGTDIPPPPPVVATAASQEAAHVKARQASAVLTPAEGWAGTQLQIAERDVLFALRKVFASGSV
ncbi:hypothetical protein ABB37_06940 [Leptomonas pyrrhocoris]|uniref:Uncharacterized protein n=1 Tax=Leptomonas pyrrhocoris TaxID=157538 RepID=A0A0M9FWT2_LEPPY|nr:hypothetical protein ABB37_06940 [Leptomonas pyrrhocoris]XP_015656008.1 hypothetical protein ABB37_06940 [Leptomonas pyrrhocoris]KPA77568.1 hypothetical protein ABB37_06940 [Leptomonas pyrrhocoris]KPA77569.1 hypothetical protein ABB37_06940 [Leptomonas pyrrhocoris]|eukprot:XP_015656007.1 hypothetical protein ABB37_06940 [Leptomonas pyrrhocoris]